MSTAQYCFVMCSFRIDGKVETAMEAEESKGDSCDQELAATMNVPGATGVTYDHYIAMDAAIILSDCQSITEIIVNVAVSEAVDCDDDNEHEPQDSGELADPSFGDAAVVLDHFCRYITLQKRCRQQSAFQAIEKYVALSSEQKKQQSSIVSF
ncbi:hypothetical protein HPB50_010118 [Hyalomma asiaticum]|uniref:Uncharacterized protein n=1 Tax=Hyalomma asiaticum TaxID=266040 RepID=A0ACB7RQ85_HYAAI|nr:hypothetical protein HPB50_010118 [Hyalomma asiaticum]